MADRTLRRIFILTAIALIVWLIYILMPVVLPFVGAFLVAYLFSPLVGKLSEYHIPRWLSTSIVFLGIAIGLFIAIWFVIPLLWKQVMYAKNSIPAGITWINHTLLPWAEHTFNLEPMRLNTDQLSNAVMGYVQTNYSVDSIQALILKLAQSGLNFIQIGGTVILVPIVAFYFLLDWERMLVQMRRLIPRPYEASTMRIVRECHGVLGAFVKGQFLVMVLLGAVYAIGLQVVGLEIGLIIGMVAGLASIIPYLGFAVGIISAVVATLFQFGLDWTHLLLVGVVFMIGQIIEGYILQPFLLGDKIGLPPVAVVFAVLAGAHLGGILGMLVALPVAAIIVVLLKHARECYEKTNLYGKPKTITDTVSIEEEYVQVTSNLADVEIKIKSQQDAGKSSNIDAD
ncbi:chloramphenicol efflux transporter CxpE [Acinetobacter sp. MD2(2019)]|uniref:chloramphenicol efflux transporter CxpE n=1 Tax=Acinetobacter sp. MD2(2019) TaxID=2605273 RepID=UPI002D1F4335|nr:AI-2E family transporter [Acinetobacter sp. MD2(2019)]MEB3753477.1 AI-2E family transporter [Acinetobacter sp. MD2(2019)]